MSIQPIQKMNASDLVADQLKKLIFEGYFKPGDRLPGERLLAEKFGVTRTTLREAIKKLEQLKLLLVRQGEGAHVLDFREHAGLDILIHLVTGHSKLSHRLLVNLMEARTLVGSEVARLAALRCSSEHLAELQEIPNALQKIMASTPEDTGRIQKLDFDFYHTLARASDNLVFVFVFNTIKPLYFRFSEFFHPIFGDTHIIANSQNAILDAIRTSNSPRAQQEAHSYLQQSSQRMVQYIEKER